MDRHAMTEEITLSLKHQAFVDAYLTTFNATKSAIAAGYSEATARQQGSRLLSDANITRAIQARMREAAMTADEVLYHLAEIGRGNIRDVTDANGNLDLARAEMLGKTGIIRKVKNRAIVTEDSDINETEVEVYDKTRALELIGKHHALFTDVSKTLTWQDELLTEIKANTLTYAQVLTICGGDSGQASEFWQRAGLSLPSTITIERDTE